MTNHDSSHGAAVGSGSFQQSRILVDSPDTEAVFDRDILSRMGHGILACRGPDVGTICPILDEGHCDMVDDAHGVIFQLDLDQEQHRNILTRYVEVLDPGIPLRAKVRPGQEERFADLLEGLEVWTEEPSVADLDAFSSRVEAYERTSVPDSGQ